MDEFRKPYEYEEEKIGGFLLIFVAMLVTADLFFSLALSVQGYNAIKHIPVAGIVFLVLSVLFILFILFTAVSCYKLKKNAVKISKTYLITRTIFTVIGLILIFFADYNNKNLIGVGSSQYKSQSELTLIVLILPMLYTLTFSIGWYLYFLKSKKCKEIARKST